MCRSGCTSRGSPSTLLSMIDFGLVDAVDADAVGPPGQRHFRLRARVGDQYASLWLEKEQLIEIGRIFSRLLAERSRQIGRARERSGSIHSFPEEPQVDFQMLSTECQTRFTELALAANTSNGRRLRTYDSCG